MGPGVRARQQRAAPADEQSRLSDKERRAGCAAGSGADLPRRRVSHTLTVRDYLEAWLDGKHALKPKTLALYRDMTEGYLIPQIGDVRLLELRAHHLDRMYAAIGNGRRGRPLSPSTVRRIHAVLRSALNTAVKRRLIPHSPAEHVELAPENPRRPTPWNAQQCRSFLAGIHEDRLAGFYALLLVTGMRRGEAIGLRW